MKNSKRSNKPSESSRSNKANPAVDSAAADSAAADNTVDNNTLSFSKLTAMIIGSTIGGGIFTTAGDMAASGAHTGSVLIGWAICGIGMFAW